MMDRMQADRLSEITQRLFRIERLACMPQVLCRLLEALGNSKTDAAQLERILESDQALTSKVLSLANSAFYGFPGRITTIRRAVVALGYKELKLLALGTGLSEVFNPAKMPPGFGGQGLWIHTLSVSWLAGELAEKAGYHPAGEVSAAGLLHDLGKLVLCTHLHDETNRIIERLKRGVPFNEAEAELGIPHTVLGYILAKKWALPRVHRSAILYHHNPYADSRWPLSTSLVALADSTVKEYRLGVVHGSSPVDSAYLLRQTRLTERQVQGVMDEAREVLPRLVSGWQRGIFGVS